MTVNTVTRGDALAREEFERLIQSEHFGTIQARIRDELKRAQDICERGGSSLEVRRAQGAVAALKAAMTIPVRILSEMSK